MRSLTVTSFSTFASKGPRLDLCGIPSSGVHLESAFIRRCLLPEQFLDLPQHSAVRDLLRQ